MSYPFGNLDFASLEDGDVNELNEMFTRLDSGLLQLGEKQEGGAKDTQTNALWVEICEIMAGTEYDDFTKCKAYIIQRKRYFDLIKNTPENFTQYFANAFLDCSVNILKQIFSTNFTPTTRKLQKDLYGLIPFFRESA